MESIHIHDNHSLVSYLFLTCTFLGTWIHSITKDDITFYIAVISGVAGTLSFIIKMYKDIVEMADRKKQKHFKK